LRFKCEAEKEATGQFRKENQWDWHNGSSQHILAIKELLLGLVR